MLILFFVVLILLGSASACTNMLGQCATHGECCPNLACLNSICSLCAPGGAMCSPQMSNCCPSMNCNAQQPGALMGTCS